MNSQFLFMVATAKEDVLKTPVATPCRGLGQSSPDPDVLAEDLNLSIPSIDDKNVRCPDSTIRLSPSAVESRLRRVFTPNVSGAYKVSTQIVQQWRDRKKGRKNLEKLFQSCGFCVDRVFTKKYHRCLYLVVWTNDFVFSAPKTIESHLEYNDRVFNKHPLKLHVGWYCFELNISRVCSLEISGYFSKCFPW